MIQSKMNFLPSGSNGGNANEGACDTVKPRIHSNKVPYDSIARELNFDQRSKKKLDTLFEG